MAKSLSTGIRINTKSAINNLDKLVKKLDQVERKMKRFDEKNAGIENTIKKATESTKKLNKATGDVANSANKVNKNFQKTNSSVGVLTKNLRRLASTYLGIMGAKAVLNTSDIITSSENKLNNITGDPTATQTSMDKMYASANKVRMNYADMMTNVSKSMTLASGAFEDNIDNAIRFQEIMSEAYTIGGASAAEMSSSMYQMIQALGSGILQGDELRSIREGAPVAYKEIEKFAQGVYKTEESLKDLASQGKITSDLVVAAVMNAGDKIDKQFSKTQMTFAQGFTQIKNIAIKSFEPVLQSLNKALNYLNDNGAFDRLAVVFQVLAGAIKIVVESIIWWWGILLKIFNLIADHWDVIVRVILTGIVLIASYIMAKLIVAFIVWIGHLSMIIWWHGALMAKQLAMLALHIKSTAVAIAGWLAQYWAIALVIAILAVLLIAIIWVAEGFVDACGIIVGSVYATGTVIMNILKFIGNLIGALMGFGVAVAQNIGIAFVNAWYGAQEAFWNFIGDVLSGLQGLEQPINAILEAFDKAPISISAVVDNARSKASSAASKQKEYVSVSDTMNEWGSKFQYGNIADSYNKGYNVGTKGGQWVLDKLGAAKDWLTGNLGLDNGLPNASDPAYNVADSYKTPSIDDLTGGVGDIADNTGKIKDSMDLTQEDLDYLRRIADMEWKKEFTTANITVDMSNYNTINNEADLDGIVTKLSEKLYEEMNAVADGVYV